VDPQLVMNFTIAWQNRHILCWNSPFPFVFERRPASSRDWNTLIILEFEGVKQLTNGYLGIKLE